MQFGQTAQKFHSFLSYTEGSVSNVVNGKLDIFVVHELFGWARNEVKQESNWLSSDSPVGVCGQFIECRHGCLRQGLNA